MENKPIKTQTRPRHLFWKPGKKFQPIRIRRDGCLIIVYSFHDKRGRRQKKETVRVFTNMLRLYEGYKKISREEYYQD
jgi:hypothetical protein